MTKIPNKIISFDWKRENFTIWDCVHGVALSFVFDERCIVQFIACRVFLSVVAVAAAAALRYRRRSRWSAKVKIGWDCFYNVYVWVWWWWRRRRRRRRRCWLTLICEDRVVERRRRRRPLFGSVLHAWIGASRRRGPRRNRRRRRRHRVIVEHFVGEVRLLRG